MLLKVCGMRNPKNISKLVKLKPDFIGFIFYTKSKRFISELPQIEIPSEIKKVGVFVNEKVEKVLEIVSKHQLNAIQLHGNETPEYCSQLRDFTSHSKLVSKSNQVEILKAFAVNDNFNFKKTKPYEEMCDYFLFDTKGKDYGGNGIKFNWDVLQNYQGEIPYLLSGGITKNDTEKVKSFMRKKESKLCIGLDINSGFEIEPALKNIDEIKEFKNQLQ